MKNLIKITARSLLGLCFIGMTNLAFSHHGWSWYGNESFTLTAQVAQVRLGNPHDRLIVIADGQQWNILLSPPNRSRRAGFDENSLEVGDVITIFGHRRSEGDNFEVKTARIQAGDQLYNFYPTRG